MELREISGMTELFVSMFTKSTRVGVLSNAIVALAVWVGLFILQGFGLYAMAKRLGMKKKALAFVPFANIYYMGKLAGEGGFFGHKLKRAWLYALIFQAISTLYYLLFFAAEFYLFLEHGTPTFPEVDPNLATDITELLMGVKPDWGDLSGFSLVAYNFYVNGSAIMAIVDLITLVFVTIFISGLYRKYSPRNYRMFTILTIFFPFLRYIFVFAMRNNEPIDYEEYVRRQQEAYIRRQQQYYNTYGNPYGTPYNPPYGNGYNRPTPPPQNPAPPEEPFGEFNEGEPFEELSGQDKASDKKEENSDGFFD